MEIFLQILGVLALVVFILILGAILWFRSVVRRFAKGGLPPSTVDLTPETESKWMETSAVKRDLDALKGCGYVCGTAYAVGGMPGVSVLTLYHPDTGTYGGYYQHPAVGNFLDLCAEFADGLSLTISTAPKGEELDTRPGTEKIFRPKENIPALHALMVKRVAERPVTQAAPDGFRDDFMAAYAKDMAWRNAKGGVSTEEFQRIAARHGATLTAELIEEALKETKLQEIRIWSDEALEVFQKTTTLSVAEWKRYEYTMVIAREGLHPSAYLDYLHLKIAVESEVMERCRQRLELNAGVARLLAVVAAETGHTFMKLGEVEQPAKFEIYAVKAPVEEKG